MDAFTASLRRERAYRGLLPLFFLSGGTGLIYQTLWARQLHLVFGTSTLAVTTVLAAFMAGLGIGGALMGRWATRLGNPLRAYGLLELGIGLYALAFPVMLGVLQGAYVALARRYSLDGAQLGLLQFALVGSTLVAPTAMMGATLPLLARFATSHLGAAGARVGTLYGVNTAGAVAGTAVAGFWLLPALGLASTNTLAAAANLALGAGAFALAGLSPGAEDADIEGEVVADAPAVRRVLLVAFLAGAASLVYEVAWTRVLGLILGGSVYAFSVMLLAFLTGIAAGGWAGGGLADRALARDGWAGVVRWLVGIEVGVGVCAFLLMFLFPELPLWYVWLFDALGAARSPNGLVVVSVVVSLGVMLLPTFGMGLAFPLAARALVRDAPGLARSVGDLYGVNTLGSLIGAVLTGFVLLPGLGIRGAIGVGVALNLLAAATLAGRRLRVGLVAAAVLALFVRPPWDEMMMTAGLYKYVSSFSDHSREGIEAFTLGNYELIFYEEGISSVVTVVRNPETGNIWLANNGKVDASSNRDMPTQLMLGALPLQHAPEARQVAVIGLASGVSAGVLTLSERMEGLHVAELEPAVGRAARWFDPVNFGVLDDPRLDLRFNDGRNELMIAPPGRYDLVVSEPPNPWISGVSNLFTLEFFELGKSRLAQDGVWSQWLQTYAMSRRDLQSVLHTFATVYPYMAVYTTPTKNDLVLLGSERPLPVGPAVSAALWVDWPELGDALDKAGVGGPAEVVALYQTDRAGVLAFAEDAPLNTDDNLRIEYSAPNSLHRATSADNATSLARVRRVPFEAYRDDPEGLALLGEAYRANEDWTRAVAALRGAADLLPEGDAQAIYWRKLAHRWTEEGQE